MTPPWFFASENSAGSRYFFSRTALNVPCFDGPSPTSGEKSTSPVIKSGVSNFPLNVKVPASRPTLPIRNSTGPENVTEFPSAGVHFASEGLAPAQTLDCGSVTVRVPFPSFCASKRRKRCWSLAKVMSTFQLPVTFGDSASARTKENVFTAITRIIARAAFTFFSTSDLMCAQIHWVLRLQFTRSIVGTHELFSEFPIHPHSHATARQAIHRSLITNHRLRSWRRRWASSRRWESSWCWGRPRGCSGSRLGGRSRSRRWSRSRSWRWSRSRSSRCRRCRRWRWRATSSRCLDPNSDGRSCLEKADGRVGTLWRLIGIEPEIVQCAEANGVCVRILG